MGLCDDSFIPDSSQEIVHTICRKYWITQSYNKDQNIPMKHSNTNPYGRDYDSCKPQPSWFGIYSLSAQRSNLSDAHP